MLRRRYPGLSLVAEDVIEGVYDVSHDGVWLTSYLLRIEISESYPIVAPRIFEIGGRIPRTLDHHVNSDGSLCLGVPEELWVALGGEWELGAVLDGPVRSFLIGVTSKLQGGAWPYGERAHGAEGLCQFYASFIGTADPERVIELLKMLARDKLKGHWDCPCGSGLRLRNCHGAAVAELHRKKLPPEMLARSGRLIFHAVKTNIGLGQSRQ